MTSARPVAAVLSVLLLCVANAEASCPSVNLVSCCGISWYQFDVNSTCVSTYGVSSTTLSSCSNSGYKYNPGVGDSASWSFVVPADGTTINAGATYYRKAHWSVSLSAEFNSPTHSSWDNLSATLRVQHNGSYTSYGIFSYNGAVSTVPGCGGGTTNFSAVNGDTIYVDVTGGGDQSATVKTAIPIIFNTD